MDLILIRTSSLVHLFMLKDPLYAVLVKSDQLLFVKQMISAHVEVFKLGQV